ncbi:7-cyano-7-deazaguanine synthase QueC [candidate division KSB1 bacterium]|nr:7-cyano-7-deazaguanine synthase QueC [candidate division KSB1 bacterium]
MTDTKKAVVLLSGGIDSTTVLAIAKSEGYTCYAMSFDYGQRHKSELEAANVIAQIMEAETHIIQKLDLRIIGGSALISETEVPKDRSESEMSDSIPVTYVPARNTIFLSHALGWAEVLNANDIFIGVNALDYSGYPDCRPEYIKAFERMANLATRAGVEGQHLNIRTPLIELTKAQIIQKGLELGVDYNMTRSCYDPDSAGLACGHCDSCQLRRKGFHEAGVPDPTLYKENGDDDG